jgi:hypothetical protein
MAGMRMIDISVVIFFAVAAAMTTEPATAADATWFCAMAGSLSAPEIRKYRVVGKEMTDLSQAAFMKRWGVDDVGLKYQVLEDTPHGIVAVLSHVTKPGDSDSFVWVKVILINKQTGEMRELSLSTEKPGEDSAHGHCELG